MTYKTTATIQDASQIVLTGLPFSPGELVEVVVASKADHAHHLASLRELFARTQSLPEARSISDEEILAEIEGYRSSRE